MFKFPPLNNIVLEAIQFENTVAGVRSAHAEHHLVVHVVASFWLVGKGPNFNLWNCKIRPHLVLYIWFCGVTWWEEKENTNGAFLSNSAWKVPFTLISSAVFFLSLHENLYAFSCMFLLIDTFFFACHFILMYAFLQAIYLTIMHFDVFTGIHIFGVRYPLI